MFNGNTVLIVKGSSRRNKGGSGTRQSFKVFMQASSGQKPHYVGTVVENTCSSPGTDQVIIRFLEKNHILSNLPNDSIYSKELKEKFNTVMFYLN